MESKELPGIYATFLVKIIRSKLRLPPPQKGMKIVNLQNFVSHSIVMNVPVTQIEDSVHSRMDRRSSRDLGILVNSRINYIVAIHRGSLKSHQKHSLHSRRLADIRRTVSWGTRVVRGARKSGKTDSSPREGSSRLPRSPTSRALYHSSASYTDYQKQEKAAKIIQVCMLQEARSAMRARLL